MSMRSVNRITALVRGAGGTIFRFVMEYEHVDFPSAVRRLAQRAGIPVVEETGSARDDRLLSMRGGCLPCTPRWPRGSTKICSRYPQRRKRANI